MAFDIGAGLSEMGKTVAQATSVGMLEQMKSQNEIERIKLANDLAAERESRGRKEAHGYDMEKMDKEHTFRAAESKADRENRLQTTQISAGATIYSANTQLQAAREGIAARIKEAEADRGFRLGENEKDRKLKVEEGKLDRDARREDRNASLKNHLDGIEMQINAMKPERDATVAARNIETQAKKFVLDARTELAAAMESGDQAAIIRAKNKVSAAEFSASDDAKIAALQGNALKIAENDLASARSKLAEYTSKNQLDLGNPNVKTVQSQLQKAVDDAEREYRQHANRFKALIDDLVTGRPSGTDRRPLSALPGAPTPGAAAPTTLPGQPQGLLTFGGR